MPNPHGGPLENVNLRASTKWRHFRGIFIRQILGGGGIHQALELKGETLVLQGFTTMNHSELG